METRKSGLDFSNTVPKILTIYNAKGLTFDSALMPRLVRKSFPGTMAKWANRLLYVRGSHAGHEMALPQRAFQGATIAELDRVRRLADEKPPVITLQRERPAQARARARRQVR